MYCLKRLLKKYDMQFYCIFIFAGLSILLSFRIYPINPDGITFYLPAAMAYLSHGVKAAMQIYPWPFYSILIAWTSQLFHVSLENSAKLLDGLFCVLMSLGYLSVIAALEGNRRVQFATIALLMVYTHLNNTHNEVMRDFGYWAFSILAFAQILWLSKKNLWSHGVAWGGYMLLAFLFRPEGIIVFLGVPVAFCFIQKTWKIRVQLLIKSYCIPFVGCLILSAYYCLYHQVAVLHTGRISELFFQITHFWQLIIHNVSSAVERIRNVVLNKDSRGDAVVWFLSGFTGVFFSKILHVLAILNIFLFIYSIKEALFAKSNEKIVLYFAIAINLIIALTFFAEHLFLDYRYITPAVLLLFLWTPFALEAIYEKWLIKKDRKKNAWLFFVVSVLFLVSIVGTFRVTGPSKVFIVEAGEWLNKHVPATATIYSNDKQVLFYTSRNASNVSEDYDSAHPENIEVKKFLQYDYAAILINHKSHEMEAMLMTKMNAQPMMVFHNNRNDKVVIFKMTK